MENSYGIIILSHVSIKSQNNHRAETTTQALFGEIFRILEEQKEWTKIQLLNDGYTGFVQNQQWIEIRNVENINLYANKKNLLQINSKKYKIHIPIGANIWKNNVDHPLLSQFKFSKKAKFNEVTDTHSPKKIIKTSKKFLGSPYLWGGKTTAGIDCSGLVQVVFQVNGIQLPRDAYQQAEIGENISIDKCKPGDLAFFTQSTDKITHVGIVYEVNKKGIKIIHSSAFVRIDSLDTKGIFYINDKSELVYSHNLKFIKRLILS